MSGTDPSAEAQRWMRFAEEDLQTAEALLSDEELIPRHACWLAQQAAEKALKAGLVFDQVVHPFRHDLDALRNLLPERWTTKQEQPDLAELSIWAVEARYPGDWPEATASHARRAVAQARSVYESVRADLARRGLDLIAEGGAEP